MSKITILSIIIILLGACASFNKSTDNGLLLFQNKYSKWSCVDLPLVLEISNKLPEKYVNGLLKAVKVIESHVKRKLFIIDRLNKDVVSDPIKVDMGTIAISIVPNIIGENDTITDGEIIAITKFNRAESGRLLSILILFTPDTSNIVGVAIHELLHALGFAHDTIINSIMYTAVLSKASQTITKRDASLLRFLYNSKRCLRKSWYER